MSNTAGGVANGTEWNDREKTSSAREDIDYPPRATTRTQKNGEIALVERMLLDKLRDDNSASLLY